MATWRQRSARIEYLRTFAQRRHDDRHTSAVVEILRKVPALTGLRQILLCPITRCHPKGRIRTSAELAFLQDPQQLEPAAKRQFSNLVQKHHSPVAISKRLFLPSLRLSSRTVRFPATFRKWRHVDATKDDCARTVAWIAVYQLLSVPLRQLPAPWPRSALPRTGTGTPRSWLLSPTMWCCKLIRPPSAGFLLQPAAASRFSSATARCQPSPATSSKWSVKAGHRLVVSSRCSDHFFEKPPTAHTTGNALERDQALHLLSPRHQRHRRPSRHSLSITCV